MCTWRYSESNLVQLHGNLILNKIYIQNKLPKRAKIALNLTSEGLRYPPEVRVEHKTCSTICGTPFQVILNQNNLTGLAGGVREGQNMAQNVARAVNSM